MSVVLAMGMGFDLIDGVCVNCTDYGQRFCGFVLRSGEVSYVMINNTCKF